MTDLRDVKSESTTFPVIGIIAMAIAVLFPAILFTEILSNWNEDNPLWTVIITVAIGLIAGGILVRTYVKSNWKWMIWVFIAFFIYGMTLGYWGV